MRSLRIHHGFMLLEVVVAVGLLVLGMAVIGAQIQSSLLLTHETDRLARVVFLAESKIAELDTGLIEPEQEIEEDFGRLFPAYAWRMTIEPTEEEELFLITLEILYDPTRDVEEDFDFDEAAVERVYYTLRAAPRPLDLTTDFGMDEEVAEKLNEDLAGLGGGSLDVHDFNPAFFRDLDVEEIAEALPVLMQAFSSDLSSMMALVPEEMRPQLEAWFAEMEAQIGDGEDLDVDNLGEGVGAGAPGASGRRPPRSDSRGRDAGRRGEKSAGEGRSGEGRGGGRPRGEGRREGERP